MKADNKVNEDPKTRRAFCGLASLNFATKTAALFLRPVICSVMHLDGETDI